MKSIRRRLVIGLAIGLTAIWLCGAGLAAVAIEHELDEVFDESLRETARRLLALVASDASREGDLAKPLEIVREDEDEPPARSEDYREELLGYVVRDDEGRVVLLARGERESDFLEDAPDGFSQDDSHRFYTESTPSGELSIQIADPLWHRRAAAFEALLAVAAPLPILLVLSALLGWWLVRYVLGDIRAMRTELESRGGRNLEPLALDAVPLELRPVVESVNRMLERLKGALETERGLASSTAHELRTPIATALAQTQRLVATVPPGDARDRARGIATSLSDLGRLAEKLVQLGRAESGFMDTGERCDGAAIIPLVIDEFRHLARGSARLDYRVVGEPRFESSLDPDGFAIVLRNLIENALKHGVPGAPVVIELDGTNNRLRIANDTFVAPSDTPDAFRARFARGATTAPGAGLGLAIVDAILDGTELSLELCAAPPDRACGFEATLRESPPV